MKTLQVYTDGAYRRKYGGLASYGYVVKTDSKTVNEDHDILTGEKERLTNNYAEYMAPIKALKWIKKNEENLVFDQMIIRADSQLVVKQINREWSIKSDNLKDLYKELRDLIDHFKKKGKEVKIEHIGREKNERADELSQLAIEDHILARDLKDEETRACPECGEKMVVREGKYGKFWGCTNYPDCDHTEDYEEED